MCRRETGSRPCVGYGGKGVEQILGGAGQTVEPGHYQHIAGFELIERFAKLITVGFGPASGFPEHLPTSDPRQLADRFGRRLKPVQTPISCLRYAPH